MFVVFAWTIAVAGLCASLGFVSASTGDVLAKKVDIDITNNDENFFITEGEISTYFYDEQNPVISSAFGKISPEEIEKKLNSHPAIENAEVSLELTGDIHVELKQRTPIVRVINKNGESYYIDSETKLMPLNDNFTARVLIASGELFEPFARRYQYSVQQMSENSNYSSVTMLDDIYQVAEFIAGDSVLTGLVHQMYITSEREIELFPSVGGNKIIFGSAENIQEKFNKLKLFYTQGLNKIDAWTKYSAINLKYKNLVVCTRK